MNSNYLFSPITDQATFTKALEFIVEQLDALSLKFFSEKLPVSYIKVFAHYPQEYSYLHELVSGLGQRADFSSNESLYVSVDMPIGGHHIRYIGLRVADPYRLQVGCGDWEVPDFASFREQRLLPGQMAYIRDAKDSTDMLEVWHPDIPLALGYIIPQDT